MEKIGIFGPFGPNLDTVNTNTQHQLGIEYIRDARYVFQGSNQDDKCIHGTLQTRLSRLSRIWSHSKEDIKAK